jgi:hypothetical protein
MQAQPFMLIMESMPPKIRSLGMSTVVSIGMMGQYVFIEMYMIVRGGVLPMEHGHSRWLEVIWMLAVMAAGIAINGYWVLYPKIVRNDGKTS